MANIMSMRDVRNHVHRNGFDLSERNCFTAKVGELLPVMCKEVLPGDKFKIDLNSFTRTAPVQTAAFTRIQEYYDFYFVPMSLLWDKFNNYIVQTNHYNHSRGVGMSPDNFISMPYITTGDLYASLSVLRQGEVDKAGWARNGVGMYRYESTLKLLEYLGYSNKIKDMNSGDYGNIQINPFPIFAYQKIYSDHFRFSNWENSRPYLYNVDYIMSNNQLHIPIADYYNSNLRLGSSPLDLQYANYKKDLLMGLLPTAQFGDTAIAAPLQGSQRVALGKPEANGDYNNGAIGLLTTSKTTLPSTGSGLGVSVFALRFAEASQKWKEVTNSGNMDFKSQLEKHWNVKTSNDQSYLSQYLGGISSNVAINEVVNNNISTESSQALIAGKGLGGSSRNGVVNFESHEYGYIMCIYHAVPLLDWKPSGWERYVTKVHASDYAIPEFDSLGMEELPSYIYDASFLVDGSVGGFLGYVPRYIDYKTSRDFVRGAFVSSLKDWAAPIQDSAYIPTGDTVSWLSFKVSPKALDSIFLASAAADSTVDSDHLLCSAFFDIKAVRNLSVSGLPY